MHEEVWRDVNGLSVAVTAGYYGTCTVNVNKLRWHVADKANHSVGEQNRALKEEHCEQSPEERFRDVNAGLTNGRLRVALELTGRCGRTFRVEDGRETRRWLPLVLHCYLLVELAVFGIKRVARGGGNRTLHIFADRLSAWDHVVVDLSLEVLVERRVVGRRVTLVARCVNG